MKNELKEFNQTTFESIKRINEFGQEFWYARELQIALEYKDYRNFEATIFKAMEACKNSGNIIADHFGDVTEMVSIGSGASRQLSSYVLSRYACYLIAMNGDPRKHVIADAQTYFAVQTRRQEIHDNFEQVSSLLLINRNVLPWLFFSYLIALLTKKSSRSVSTSHENFLNASVNSISV